MGTSDRSAPAIGPDGTIYITSVNSTQALLMAFDPAAGAEKWRLNLGQTDSLLAPTQLAVLVDGTIYLRMNYTHGIPARLWVVKSDGTLKWVRDLNPPSGYCCGGETVAILSDGTAYASAPAVSVSAPLALVISFDALGNERWQFPMPFSDGYLSSPAIGDDGAPFVLSTSSLALALNPDGTQRWLGFPGTLTGVIAPATTSNLTALPFFQLLNALLQINLFFLRVFRGGVRGLLPQ